MTDADDLDFKQFQELQQQQWDGEEATAVVAKVDDKAPIRDKINALADCVYYIAKNAENAGISTTYVCIYFYFTLSMFRLSFRQMIAVAAIRSYLLQSTAIR